MKKSMIIFGLLVCISSLLAQNSATLRLGSINSTTVSHGDAISVPVNCDEITPGSNVLGFAFAYDHNVLEWTDSGQNFEYFYVTDTNGYVCNYDSYTASFHVSSEGNDLENALVKVGGQSDTTNAQGIAELLLPDGEHFYTVTKEGFAEANGSFSITGEPVQVEVEMEVCSYVSLHVTSNGGTLTGCTITIGNYVYNNDTASSVCIPAGTYPFSVSKPGYITVSGFIPVPPVGPYIINVVLLPMYYEVTFFVNCCGEPLENYPITFEGQTLLTNTAGMAIMVLPSGFYSIVIGGFPVTFTVPDTTYVEVDVCSEITIHVSSNGVPLQGASVTVNDETLITNANGIAVFCLSNGSYTFIVSKYGYETISGTFTVNGESFTLEVAWASCFFPVTFNLTGLSCNNSFDDFIIAIYYDTISFGETIFLSIGYYPYSVYIAGCTVPIESGYIEVSPAPMTIEIDLSVLPHATFQVSSTQAGSISDAEIIMEGDTLYTNSTGEAAFCMSGGEHYYAINKENYDTIFGSFDFLCQDISIDILMDPVSVNDNNSSAFRLYPNPSGGLFYLENLNRALNMTEITIQDITGRIVYHQETATDDKVEIDLKSQPKGMYFIRAKAGEKILNKKLVIQ